MKEYRIIPISFKDYNDYVESLNEYGNKGWIFSNIIRVYENSPINGVTTHDYICYRKKKWWRMIFKNL